MINLENADCLSGDGIYLVSVDGLLRVAEFNEPDNWYQIGADWDVWTHSYTANYNVKVIGKIDLEALAIYLQR